MQFLTSMKIITLNQLCIWKLPSAINTHAYQPIILDYPRVFYKNVKSLRNQPLFHIKATVGISIGTCGQWKVPTTLFRRHVCFHSVWVNLKILQQAIPKLEAMFSIFTEFMPFISLSFNAFPALLFIFYLINFIPFFSFKFQFWEEKIVQRRQGFNDKEISS